MFYSPQISLAAHKLPLSIAPKETFYYYVLGFCGPGIECNTAAYFSYSVWPQLRSLGDLSGDIHLVHMGWSAESGTASLMHLAPW